MRNSIILTSAIAIMLIGMVGSVVILLDEERMKALVIAQAEASSGRKVEILGSLRVRLFPRLRLSAESIVFRNASEVEGPILFEAERLDMSLRLLPLIRGQAVSDEIRLSGARLNLQGDDNGPGARDGDPVQLESPEVAGLAAAPITVDGLVVQVSDASDRVRQVFEVEQVYLSGFALDRPVAFRFSGNLGEPPLFDRVEVEGRLISTAGGQVRLAPMHLRGSLEQGRYLVDLTGDLGLRGGSEPAVSLSGGRLAINQHEFELGLQWLGRDRPQVTAALSAELIDVDVLALLDQLAGWAQDPARQAAVSALAAMDIDLDLSVGRVAQLGLVLNDLNVGLSARDGQVRLNPLQSTVPGGMMAASAELDLRATDPRWLAVVDLDLARADRFLQALRQDFSLSGAGRLQLQLESLSRPGGSSWQGRGQLSLWDGRWTWLAWLKSHSSIAPADAQFASLESVLVLGPGRIEWQSLALAGSHWQAEGDLEVFFPHGEMLGSLRLNDGQGMVRLLELTGSLLQPELLRPPLLIATSQ